MYFACKKKHFLTAVWNVLFSKRFYWEGDAKGEDVRADILEKKTTFVKGRHSWQVWQVNPIK